MQWQVADVHVSSHHMACVDEPHLHTYFSLGVLTGPEDHLGCAAHLARGAHLCAARRCLHSESFCVWAIWFPSMPTRSLASAVLAAVALCDAVLRAKLLVIGVKECKSCSQVVCETCQDSRFSLLDV